MSREIQLSLGSSGNTKLYFRRLNASNQYWRCDTSVYENFNSTNIAKYGAATGSSTPYNILTEDGSTGIYFGNDPTAGNGMWICFEQLGAEPSEVNDFAVGEGTFIFNEILDSVESITSITAAEIWNYINRTLTQTATQIADAISGSDLTIHRGDSFSATLTGLGNLTGRKYLWFTVKRIPMSEPDSSAKIQITEIGGLIRLNGSVYNTVLDGSITVDAGETSLSIFISGAATSLLHPEQNWYYDLQVLNSSDEPVTIASGNITVNADITRAISD